MAICQYFQRGQCRYGTACKNDHVQTGAGNQTYVRPGADKVGAYTSESIKNDLTMGKERPIWPLASYGPAKFEPTLLSGLDESPEELRLKAATAMKAGNVNEYLSYESSKMAAAEQVFSNAISNVFQVLEQATKNSGGASTPASTSAFGAAATPSATFGGASTGTSVFGKSAFGQSPFGQSGFAAAAKPSVFGQPNPTSAFGQPSAFGQAAPSSAIKPATGGFAAFANNGSAFGAGASSSPAAPATAGGGFSAFSGKPSVFGASAAPSGGSVFGQPSLGPAPLSTAIQSAFGNTTAPPFGALPTTSAFGTSAFGASATTSPFSISNPNPSGGNALASNPTPSAFGGGPSAFSNPSGGSAFASNVPNANPPIFGGGSGNAFANNASNTNPPVSAFTTSPFGVANNSSGSAFASNASNANTPSAFSAFAPAKPSVFGPQTTNPFSAQPTTAPAPSPFNSQATSAFSSQPSSGFAAQPSAFAQPASQFTSQPTSQFSAQPTSQFPSQPASAFTQQSAFNSQSSLAQSTSSAPPAPDFRNAKVSFRQGLTPYDSQLPPNYMSLLPESAVAAFKAEKFQWGNIPDWVPPLELR